MRCASHCRHGRTIPTATTSIRSRVVQDTTKPFLNLAGNQTHQATSAAGAVVTYTATANDSVDGPITSTCNPPSGSTFPLETTTVTCSATDAHGNTKTAGFTVTVIDSLPPILTVPANIVVNATSTAGATVTYSPTAVDVVDGAVPVVCVPPSGSLFPIGTTTVNCTAVDTRGNSTNAPFTVTVLSATQIVTTLASRAYSVSARGSWT